MCCWHELSSLPMALVSYVNIPALTDGASGFAVCLGCWHRSPHARPRPTGLVPVVLVDELASFGLLI